MSQVFRLNGNVRNDGYIENLPDGCCVEVSMSVDGRGFRPAKVGALPVQLAALNQSNVSVQTLTVEGALDRDPELIMNAVALDPLTSACCTLLEARMMTAEMLDAQADWLPHLEGWPLKATPQIEIPAGINAVDVPLDPALAIANRFADLAERELQGK